MKASNVAFPENKSPGVNDFISEPALEHHFLPVRHLNSDHYRLSYPQVSTDWCCWGQLHFKAHVQKAFFFSQKRTGRVLASTGIKRLNSSRGKNAMLKKMWAQWKRCWVQLFFFVGGHKLTHTFFPHQEQNEAGAQEKKSKNTTWTRAPTLSEITQSAFLRVTRRLLKRVMLATVQNLWCGSYSE